MEWIKRMKFWIGLGLLVLASGAVLAVWFVPARKEGGERLSEWRSKQQKVQSYDKQNVRSPLDVQTVENLRESYAQQLKQAQQLLEAQDKLIEDYIPALDGTRKPLDPGAWKLAYATQMQTLAEEVRKGFPSTPSSVIAQTDFGPRWPSVAEMRQEAKRYWVQRYFFEALTEVNNVRTVIPVLKRFALVARPDRLLSADHAKLFTPIPFELEFSTEFESLPMILHQLLECKVGVSITTIDVKRRAKVALGGQAKAETTGRVLSASAVSGLVGPAAGIRPGAVPLDWGAAMAAAEDARFAAMIAADEALGRAGIAREIEMERERAREMAEEERLRTPGRRRATTAARRTTTTRQAQAPRVSAADAEAGLALVDVVIKGYMQDYVSPGEAQEAEAAG